MQANRRELLILIGAALLHARLGGAAEPEVSLAGTWRDLLPGPGAAPVGAAYLEATPDEASAEILAARLRERLPVGPDSELASRLLAAIRSDFERRHTVELRGWILSRTECRLSALVELELG